MDTATSFCWVGFSGRIRTAETTGGALPRDPGPVPFSFSQETIPGMDIRRKRMAMTSNGSRRHPFSLHERIEMLLFIIYVFGDKIYFPGDVPPVRLVRGSFDIDPS